MDPVSEAGPAIRPAVAAASALPFPVVDDEGDQGTVGRVFAARLLVTAQLDAMNARARIGLSVPCSGGGRDG